MNLKKCLISVLLPGSALVRGIELVDYYGTVTIKAGELQEFKCEDVDSEPGSNYYWSIGNRNYTGPVERLADNSVVTVLEFMPILEDDGEFLRCWKDGEYDQVQFSIFKQELVSSYPYCSDLPSKISAEFSLFPPPTHQSVTWRIESVEGGAEDYHPGTETENIIARKIEKLGDSVYRFSLEISELEDFVSKNISISVVTRRLLEVVYFQQTGKDCHLALVLGVPWWLYICIALTVTVFVVIFGIIFCLAKRKNKTPTQPKGDAANLDSSKRKKAEKNIKWNEGNVYIQANQDDV